MGGSDKYSTSRRSGERSSDLSSPVVGLHSVGRCISGRFCRVCLGTGEFLRPQEAISQAFTPFEGYCLAPEAPLKGECRRGRRYFWPCRTCVGFGPATGPTLKMALCHIRALVGRMINKPVAASCRGFSADCLTYVLDGQSSTANMRPKGSQLQLGHLRVGELQHCYLCIALDLAVRFKL